MPADPLTLTLYPYWHDDGRVLVAASAVQQPSKGKRFHGAEGRHER